MTSIHKEIPNHTPEQVLFRSHSASGTSRAASCGKPITRRYSTNSLIFTACDELERRLLNQKAHADNVLREQLETTIPNMRSKLPNDKDYQAAVDLLVEYYKEAINSTTGELIEGKCGLVVSKILKLQISWKPNWPDKLVITKSLLMISSFSRVVSFLVAARNNNITLSKDDTSPISSRKKYQRISEPIVGTVLPICESDFSDDSSNDEHEHHNNRTNSRENLLNSSPLRALPSTNLKIVRAESPLAQSAPPNVFNDDDFDEEGSIYCRICDQPILFSQWIKHKEKCIPKASEAQSIRMRISILDGKIVSVIADLERLLETKSLDECTVQAAKQLITAVELLHSSMHDENAHKRCQEICGILVKQSHNQNTKFQEIISDLRNVIELKGQLINLVSNGVFQKPTINDFEIIKPISKGAYGRVFLARKKATGDFYAMKVINKEDTEKKNQIKNIIMERDILHSVQNQFVVRLFYTFQSPEYLFWVMEYVQGGDLYSLLKGLNFFEEDMAQFYAAEIVIALEYIHSKGIVHRDLKPDNLLINIDGHIKLTDFGLSRSGLGDLDFFDAFAGVDPASEELRILSPLLGGGTDFNLKKMEDNPSTLTPVTTKFHSKVGTPDYLAPEIILGQGHGIEVDWWSLGCILFEFLTGIPPFHAPTPDDIFENIVQHNIVWPRIPEELSYEAYDLISRLLTIDPAERITVQEIKTHPFFDSIDWETLPMQEAVFIPNVEDETDTSFFDCDERGGNSLIEEEIDKIQNSQTPRERSNIIPSISVERIEYEDSSSDDTPVNTPTRSPRIDEGNPYLNFSFVNLSNLTALSQETFVKNSPRILHETIEESSSSECSEGIETETDEYSTDESQYESTTGDEESYEESEENTK